MASSRKRKRTRTINVTSNVRGAVVLVTGDDNPTLLRRDGRCAGGFQRVKGFTPGGIRRPEKCATVFRKASTAARAGNKYAREYGKRHGLTPDIVVIPVGDDDKDHVTISA